MFLGFSRRRQQQSAGDGSLQIQAARDVNMGISEERAREIARSTANEVVQGHASEANAVIQDRIMKLDDRVIASLVRENRLQVFADPSFQRTYRKAQEGAASSERDADYDLLAALLADRAIRGSERPIRAGIERSIEIIDRVDDEALRGLTVFQAVMQYGPRGDAVSDGLRTMERLLGPLVDGELPTGSDWLDHLDILDAVRVDQSTGLKKFSDFWIPNHMPGYVSPGIEEGAAPAQWSDGTYTADWSLWAQPHELKPGFLRMGWPTETEMRRRFSLVPSIKPDAILAEAKTVFRFGEIDSACVESLMHHVKQSASLKAIAEWWDEIPTHFQVTAVGRVLARANAERLDVNGVLPPLM